MDINMSSLTEKFHRSVLRSRCMKMSELLFHILISWFTISHTNYILTLVGNVHILPSILKKPIVILELLQLSVMTIRFRSKIILFFLLWHLLKYFYNIIQVKIILNEIYSHFADKSYSHSNLCSWYSGHVSMAGSFKIHTLNSFVNHLTSLTQFRIFQILLGCLL